jgi:L-threonylcarbamoyladenylate synthase
MKKEFETEILQPNASSIQAAASLLSADELVAFPTETVYGLGGNCFSFASIQKIFMAKNRPQDNPLIIHVSDFEMFYNIFPKIPEIYEKLIKSHWPGPLTILLPRPDKIPLIVTAGQDTVAVRMPDHPVALELIRSCGFPLAAPSANTSGRPSPTLAEHVYNDLSGKISLILDGGPCNSGVESTVLDGLRTVPAILRPGGITVETLTALIGKVEVYRKDFVDAKLENAPTTPGMKYTHYSPNAIVYLIESNDINTLMGKMKVMYDELSQSKKVGVLYITQPLEPFPIQLPLGEEAKHVAQSLFTSLREMENLGVEVILIQGISEDNEGLAVMNRLRKAATKILVC